MRKVIIIIIAVVFITFFSMTYGKWEYLTYVHGKEFEFSEEIIHRCLLENPKVVKVMMYTPLQAQIFMKGESDSKYFIDFARDDIHSKWSLFYETSGSQPYCHFKVLFNNMGGSGDIFDVVYWY